MWFARATLCVLTSVFAVNEKSLVMTVEYMYKNLASVASRCLSCFFKLGLYKRVTAITAKWKEPHNENLIMTLDRRLSTNRKLRRRFTREWCWNLNRWNLQSENNSRNDLAKLRNVIGIREKERISRRGRVFTVILSTDWKRFVVGR